MSRIQMNIAGGYMRGEILKLIDENPTLTTQQVVANWIEARYGDFIRTHKNPKTGELAFVSPYRITDVVVEGSTPELLGRFILDFDNPNDEDYFVRHVGGKIIPSEPTDD